MKETICMAFGLVGSCVAYLLGGWDTAVVTLFIFMVIDYITGLMVAGIFHKSSKTDTGALESNASWKGLAKKFATFLIIIVDNMLDKQIGESILRDGVCITFIANECLSIIENAGLMGVPIPARITQAIDVLLKKGE